jgi:predicted PurR-regulated permease PerM
VFVAVLIIGLVAAAIYAIDLILLVFAGILLAILLRGCGEWLAERTRLTVGWSTVISLSAFFSIVFGSIWMFGVHIADQADELFYAVSQAYTQLQDKLQQFHIAGLFASGGSGLSLGAPARAAASGILWVLASMVLVLFLGLYLSINPQLYTELFLSFFKGRRRERIASLMEASGAALRWWLLGQFIAMAVVGVITTVGLLIIGTPMAVSLGVMAMLLTFVPYVGAVVSAVPAILLAAAQDTHLVVYVILVYLIAHIVEGYILVPIIQHRMVYLPPAMILATQFLMELFAGTLGVMFATPLMVIAMVLIKELYFKQDWTEEVSDVAA